MGKQNIYDRDVFFENLRQIRENPINFNDCMESPILLSLLPQTGKTLKCLSIRSISIRHRRYSQ